MFGGQFEVETVSGLRLVVHRSWWMQWSERLRTFQCKVLQVKQGDQTLVGKIVAFAITQVKYAIKL